MQNTLTPLSMQPVKLNCAVEKNEWDFKVKAFDLRNIVLVQPCGAIKRDV